MNLIESLLKFWNWVSHTPMRADILIKKRIAFNYVNQEIQLKLNVEIRRKNWAKTWEWFLISRTDMIVKFAITKYFDDF